MPPLNADLKTPDELAAYSFLAGAAEQGPPENPLVHRKYLSGEEEHMGRQALVRVLRSDRPLSTILRKKLAELFDGLSGGAVERRLEFKFRGKKGGNRPNPWANGQVAGYVAFQQKHKQLSKTEAIAAAAIFFRRDEKTIEKMIANHRRRKGGAPTR